jgi:hypothetical protein
VRAGARAAVAPRESLALGGRALAVIRGLPDHSVIDRLVRGRAWIPVLGVLLAGIVAMQVEILKLGSSMGRAMQRSSLLQTQNESLQASVAGLADDQRIARLAAGMGMSMPTPDSLVFLSAHPGRGVGRALGNIHAPDPTGFTTQLVAQTAAAAALMPAPPTTTSSPTTTTTTTPAVPGAATSGSATTVTPAAQTTGAGTTAGTAAPPIAQAVAPAAPATGAAGGTGSGPGASSTSAGGAPATGAAGVAPAGPSQSGGTTGG